MKTYTLILHKGKKKRVEYHNVTNHDFVAGGVLRINNVVKQIFYVAPHYWNTMEVRDGDTV